MAPLSFVDLWAASAAALAGACLALRSNMLKPDFRTWEDGYGTVRAAIFALSVVMGGVTVSIVQRGGASAREAVAYTALALGALVLLIRMQRRFSIDHEELAHD